MGAVAAQRTILLKKRTNIQTGWPQISDFWKLHDWLVIGMSLSHESSTMHATLAISRSTTIPFGMDWHVCSGPGLPSVIVPNSADPLSLDLSCAHWEAMCPYLQHHTHVPGCKGLSFGSLSSPWALNIRTSVTVRDCQLSSKLGVSQDKALLVSRANASMQDNYGVYAESLASLTSHGLRQVCAECSKLWLQPPHHMSLCTA